MCISAKNGNVEHREIEHNLEILSLHGAKKRERESDIMFYHMFASRFGIVHNVKGANIQLHLNVRISTNTVTRVTSSLKSIDMVRP